MKIRIREACPTDAGAIARVHVDTWRTTYAGILSAEFLAGLSYAGREQMWKQALTADRPATCMLVANMDEGDIVSAQSAEPHLEDRSTYHPRCPGSILLQQPPSSPLKKIVCQLLVPVNRTAVATGPSNENRISNVTRLPKFNSASTIASMKYRFKYTSNGWSALEMNP